MAFSNSVLFIASLIVLNVHLFSGTSAAPLDDVCSLAKNKTYCLTDFGSDPDAQTATLPQLAKLAIDKADTKANAARFKILFLSAKETDPTIKTIFRQCDSSYIDATNALTLAATDLSSQNFRDLSLHGGQASDAGVRCETFFNRPGNPLEGENLNVEFLGDIINVAANQLNSGRIRKLIY